MVIRVDPCATFEAILSMMHGIPQFDPFHQFKTGQEWRVERQKIAWLTWSLDHYSAPHYSDVIMSAMVSQITGDWVVYSTFCLGADQRKHQSFASLAFRREIHRWPMNSQNKGPVTRNTFPFDGVIRNSSLPPPKKLQGVHLINALYIFKNIGT